MENFKFRISNFKLAAGFTLVEILVVIAVIGILSVAGVAGFVSFSRVQSINAAAGELVTALNLAKSQSYSQVKPTGCTGTLEGYEVNICGPLSSCVNQGANNSSDSYYEINARCINPAQNLNRDGGILPSGYTFTRPYATFFFPVLKGGVSSAGSVTISGNGLTKTITVDSSANITSN